MSIIKNWLDRKGLQLLELLPQAEQEACDTEDGLLQRLSNKLKSQYHQVIRLLQANEATK